MGTARNLHGEIRIDPPLKWSEFRDSRFYVPDESQAPNDLIVRLIVEHETTQTDDGQLVVMGASKLVAASYDWSMYGAYDQIQEFGELANNREDRILSGELILVGQEQGDMVRYWFDNGVLHDEKAKLIWPSTGEEPSW